MMQFLSKTFLFAGAFAATFASGARAQTPAPLFFDDFNGPALDPAQWTAYDSSRFLHKTQFGGLPTFGADSDGTKWMRVPLQTFNSTPGQEGQTALGTEVFTRQQWGLGAGIEVEARLRAGGLPPGLVLGFFTYGATGKYPDTYGQTEIDWEFLTKQNSDTVWTNIWDNHNPLRGGPNQSQLSVLAGANWNNGAWHVFKVRWLPGRTEWLIDGKILRVETRVQPALPMAIRFNHWMPNSSWTLAYGTSPDSKPSDNRILGFDVDYVKVSPLTPPATGFWGDGNGLTARYFNTPDLSGPAIVRRDPRIALYWGGYEPLEGVGKTLWSARWTGFLQAQYSEKYTLTLASDDGARLWIGSDLVIDNWSGHRLTEKSALVDLKAGEKVPLRVEYRQDTNSSTVRLFWSCASTPKQTVPQSQLYPEINVAAPVFSPPGGLYYASQNVAIASNTPGAVVRYTLDGSEPTEASPICKTGAILSVKTTQLIRARAFLTDQVPSDERAANYEISTANRPLTTVDSPLNNSFLLSLAKASGTAKPGSTGSAIARVTFRLRRVADNARWNGTAWIGTDYGLATKLAPSPTDSKTVLWTSNAPFPSGANLTQGVYELKSVAVDTQNNVGTGLAKFSVDSTPPVAAIAFPKNGATVPDLWGINGAVSDNLGAANVSRVNIAIKRADGLVWNGWEWKNENTAIPTVVSGENWSVVIPASNGANLPWTTDLPDGTYEIRAIAFDKAGNASATAISVQKLDATASAASKSPSSAPAN